MSNKLTMHSGRAHSDGKTFDPKHNDRKFNVAHADNIIMAKLKHERYWNCVDKQFYGYYDKGYTSFADAELQHYTESYGHQLAETNAKYVKNRHPEKVKSMEEWMYLRQNAPEECYVQIGDSFGHPDMKTFHECFMECVIDVCQMLKTLLLLVAVYKLAVKIQEFQKKCLFSQNFQYMA